MTPSARLRLRPRIIRCAALVALLACNDPQTAPTSPRVYSVAAEPAKSWAGTEVRLTADEFRSLPLQPATTAADSLGWGYWTNFAPILGTDTMVSRRLDDRTIAVRVPSTTFTGRHVLILSSDSMIASVTLQVFGASGPHYTAEIGDEWGSIWEILPMEPGRAAGYDNYRHGISIIDLASGDVTVDPKLAYAANTSPVRMIVPGPSFDAGRFVAILEAGSQPLVFDVGLAVLDSIPCRDPLHFDFSAAEISPGNCVGAWQDPTANFGDGWTLWSDSLTAVYGPHCSFIETKFRVALGGALTVPLSRPSNPFACSFENWPVFDGAAALRFEIPGPLWIPGAVVSATGDTIFAIGPDSYNPLGSSPNPRLYLFSGSSGAMLDRVQIPEADQLFDVFIDPLRPRLIVAGYHENHDSQTMGWIGFWIFDASSLALVTRIDVEGFEPSRAEFIFGGSSGRLYLMSGFGWDARMRVHQIDLLY